MSHSQVLDSATVYSQHASCSFELQLQFWYDAKMDYLTVIATNWQSRLPTLVVTATETVLIIRVIALCEFNLILNLFVADNKDPQMITPR